MKSLNVSYDNYFKFNLLELYKFIFVMLPIQIPERKQSKKKLAQLSLQLDALNSDVQFNPIVLGEE